MAKNRMPSYYPRYDDESRVKIVRFLVACMMDLEEHLTSVRLMAGSHIKEPMYYNQVVYLESGIATIKMLVRRAHDRQRHLVEMSDKQFLDELSTCMEQ
jgi:hypothetical protein